MSPRATGATPAPAPATPVAAPDVNAMRAQRDALEAQLKALKTQTEGKIAGIAVDGQVVQVDVQMGDRSRKTTKGNNPGRPYLFNADPVEFTTPDGVVWVTSAFYAIAKAAK